MDFMLALNVTIYGLGIVFLALLVLMVVIMLLGKLFAMVTGKDILPTPQTVATAAAPQPLVAPAGAPAALVPTPSSAAAETAEAVNAPLPGKVLSVAVKGGDRVSRGDELCVIEAMKMGNSVRAPRDGFVTEVCVASGDTVPFGAPLVRLVSTPGAAASRPVAPVVAPAAPAAAPAPAVFTLGTSEHTHIVELAPTSSGVIGVLLDGARYEVRRDAGDRTKLLVNGQAHTVNVKEVAGTAVTVVIDGVTHKLEMGQHKTVASRALSLTSGGKPYKAEVAGGDGVASVVLDGATYRVERDKADPSRFVVNGQAHTVNVKEVAGTAVTVVIDGRTEKVEIAREATAPPTPVGSGAAAVAPASAPAPVTSAPKPAAGGGTPVTAPLPGKVLSIAVKVGDRVTQGDELCVIEAMKMGNSIRAQRAGAIRDVLVTPGQTVAFGAPLMLLD